MKTKLEKIIQRSKYYYVNDNLATKNFRIPKVIETANWHLIPLEKTMTSEECLDLMKSKGMRPANVYELALFRENHENEMPKGKWVVAFGSQWKDAVGSHRVPGVLCRSGGGFDFGLGVFERVWDQYHVLLCFCDEKNLGTSATKDQTLESLMPLEIEIGGVKYTKNEKM